MSRIPASKVPLLAYGTTTDACQNFLSRKNLCRSLIGCSMVSNERSNVLWWAQLQQLFDYKPLESRVPGGVITEVILSSISIPVSVVSYSL